MHRCLQLARLGMGSVAPNPLVGAVLVHNDKIIGDGYHQQFGGPHAEVNCIQSVSLSQQDLIHRATLYVSLEPCAHWGKTPPCADLIIAHKIPKVVVGCGDAFAQVNGKGIEKLRAAGVDVTIGVLEEACLAINKRFFTFHEAKRPYVILKWAQTLDGKIGYSNLEDGSPAQKSQPRLMISSAATNRLVHRWRSEEAAILVGPSTALADDPQLTVRGWPGKNPVRLVIDKNLRLPPSLRLFDGTVTTIVFNAHKHTVPDAQHDLQQQNGVCYYRISDQENFIAGVLDALYRLRIQSVIVEGGAAILQAFIAGGFWDEARVITNETMMLDEGLAAPVLLRAQLVASEKRGADAIRYYQQIK